MKLQQKTQIVCVCEEKEGMVITIAKNHILLKQETLFSVNVITNYPHPKIKHKKIPPTRRDFECYKNQFKSYEQDEL